MTEVQVRVGNRAEPLDLRINGPDPTFRLETDRIEVKALSPLDPLHEDLVEIACAVFAADSSVGRGGDTRPDMGSDWRRSLAFTIPVRRPEFWRQDAVAEALADAVGFLTEDSVRFIFVPRPPTAGGQPFLDLAPAGVTFAADEVILFSGGLDSFAGALEVLATTASKVLLLSHRSAQKVIPRQDGLGRHLAARFPGRVLHLQVRATRFGSEASETTQRSRSFLFAALGAAVAQCFGARRVGFYENGIVSHNLPVSPQVIGTMATRTTHPLALHKLNRVLDMVAPGTGRIENRYAWLTKTDVLRRIEQHGGAGQIGRAVSCTSVRDQTTLHTHCGTCSQCLDRRFAVLAAGLAARDPAESYATDVLYGARDRDRSRTMALEWTRHALRLRHLDERGFLAAFGHELQRIIRGHPDLSPQEVMRRTLDMHRRHSQAVAGVLEVTVRERSRDLVDQRFPPTSLVAMHLSNAGAAPGVVPDPRLDVPPEGPIAGDVEEDVVLEPGAPLQVAFLAGKDGHVVSVRGLGRVEGKPATVAHALKPDFDADRASNFTPEQHRFIQPVTLPGLAGMSKDAIRTAVFRCRNRLKGYHTEVHGSPPARPLLIQSLQPDGYRLDPTLRVLPSDHPGAESPG